MKSTDVNYHETIDGERWYMVDIAGEQFKIREDKLENLMYSARDTIRSSKMSQ